MFEPIPKSKRDPGQATRINFEIIIIMSVMLKGSQKINVDGNIYFIVYTLLGQVTCTMKVKLLMKYRVYLLYGTKTSLK